MKTQSKPIVALASGAVLLFGVLCQTSHAQEIIASNTVTLADANGNTSGPTTLSVQYEVTETSGVFTYDYVVSNPLGDYQGANPNYVGGFEVRFDAADAGITGLSGGFGSQNDGSSGVTWYLAVAPGGNSGTLQFQSDNAYDLNTANATGSDNPPGPWNSLNSSELVAAPNPPVIPEPATTSLVALSLVFLALKPNILKFKKS